MSDIDHALRGLRHLYEQMLNGHVRPSASDIANAARGLLGPAIEGVERVQKALTDLENAQVPTEIVCPQCSLLHVDQDEWATTRLHRKHLCHGCGHIWQPYLVTTVGVDVHGPCRARRDELLATIAKLSQTVPLESEVAEALDQRGKLVAEIGTLRAALIEAEQANTELRRINAQLTDQLEVRDPTRL